jgi:hypothetical protein
VAIVPDDKNWTWVLERPCPECGFDAADVPRDAVAGMLRDNAAAWPAVLEHAQVAVRPSEDRWSALEYACHVRDVFVLYDERLQAMLADDGVRFANWDQDATAIEERYDLQDPATVSAQLTAAADRLAERFEQVPDDAWGHRGLRSDGALFTIESFARYFVHDPIHHLHDVRMGYADLGVAPG